MLNVPFVGVNRDQIYARAKDSTGAIDTATGPMTAQGTMAGSFDANDSFLIPTDDCTW